MAQYEDVQTSTVAVAGFICAVLVFALMVLVQVLYYRQVHWMQARQQEQPPPEWSSVKAEQEARLQTRGMDQDGKTVVIPIDEAMDQVVAQYAAAPQPTGTPQPATTPKTPSSRPAGGASAGGVGHGK